MAKRQLVRRWRLRQRLVSNRAVVALARKRAQQLESVSGPANAAEKGIQQKDDIQQHQERDESW